MSSGTATTHWPIVVPSASAATTQCAGTSSTRMNEATMASSQLAARATAATFSRPIASITRDRWLTRPIPINPGANAANPLTSCETWLELRASTCAVDTLIAAITAVPSQDSSTTARVDPAQVRSNSAPSRADSTGNALIVTATASTEYSAVNTIQQ